MLKIKLIVLAVLVIAIGRFVQQHDHVGIAHNAEQKATITQQQAKKAVINVDKDIKNTGGRAK